MNSTWSVVALVEANQVAPKSRWPSELCTEMAASRHREKQTTGVVQMFKQIHQDVEKKSKGVLRRPQKI